MCSCMYVCVVCGYNNFRRSLRIRKNIEYSVCDEKLNIKYFEEYDVHSHASINSLLSSRILQSSRTKLASLSRGNYSRRRKGGGWVGGGGKRDCKTSERVVERSSSVHSFSPNISFPSFLTPYRFTREIRKTHTTSDERGAKTKQVPEILGWIREYSCLSSSIFLFASRLKDTVWVKWWTLYTCMYREGEGRVWMTRLPNATAAERAARDLLASVNNADRGNGAISAHLLLNVRFAALPSFALYNNNDDDDDDDADYANEYEDSHPWLVILSCFCFGTCANTVTNGTNS